MATSTSTFPAKRGDSGDRIVIRCTDRLGQAPPVAGTIFRFRMGPAAEDTDQPELITDDTVVVAETDRYVDVGYVFQPGDLDVVGTYRAEIAAEFVDGSTATFPSRDWLDVIVEDTAA